MACAAGAVGGGGGARRSQIVRARAHLDAALVEFKRNLIRDRTQAGLAAARARGRQGRRPRKLDEAKTGLLYKLYDEREKTVREICGLLGISKPTLYDYLERRAKTRAAAAP